MLFAVFYYYTRCEFMGKPLRYHIIRMQKHTQHAETKEQFKSTNKSLSLAYRLVFCPPASCLAPHTTLLHTPPYDTTSRLNPPAPLRRLTEFLIP